MQAMVGRLQNFPHHASKHEQSVQHWLKCNKSAMCCALMQPLHIHAHAHNPAVQAALGTVSDTLLNCNSNMITLLPLAPIARLATNLHYTEPSML
jgi:hypothetical protein